MSFRYIGSKARVVDAIGQHIGPWDGTGRFIDAFCGTGAVAEAAADLGWPVWLNDHLSCATTMAAARLISAQQAKFPNIGGYGEALRCLNALPPSHGFIWREYSPASAAHLGLERRYFREASAGKIDAIRAQIRRWRDTDTITEIEERLLIADLLAATSKIANIAGTYGCFLAKWTAQADELLILKCRTLRESRVSVQITNEEVSNLVVQANDLVYLDPPYTKRQYASYYHILETITHGDEPVVDGVAGLRPWRDRASAFCYKVKALAALEHLISNLDAERILLSYSDEGHVPIEDLRKSLGKIGEASAHIVKTIGRYRPNIAATVTDSVREYLFVLHRSHEALTA